MAHGGKREGSGKKKGSKASHTLEAQEAKKVFIGHVSKLLVPILKAQTSLALGNQYLFKIVAGISKPQIVKDEKEILAFLQGGIEPGPRTLEGHKKAVYFFLTTEKPSNEAIANLLDRAWGKPVQALAGPDGGPLFVFDEEAKRKSGEAIRELLDPTPVEAPIQKSRARLIKK